MVFSEFLETSKSKLKGKTEKKRNNQVPADHWIVWVSNVLPECSFMDIKQKQMSWAVADAAKIKSRNMVQFKIG